MPEGTHARLSLLLALADDDLVIGHRHSEWTGWAPAIEEDLAFSSIAQDEIAHAQLLYELAEPLDGRSPDELALGRHPAEYRHAIVCERPNGGRQRAPLGLERGPGVPDDQGPTGDWAYSLCRQYLYDTADDVRLAALGSSSWPELAQAVAVIRLEERYHLEHARAWLARLAADAAARTHLEDALAPVADEAPALFEPLWEEELLVRDGVLPRPNTELRDEWTSRVERDLAEMGLNPPAWGTAGTGGRTGTRSDDFAGLWDDLTGLYRSHAGARW